MAAPQAGTAQIDPNAVNTQPTAAEQQAAAERAARDKQILTENGQMPGQAGTIQIDPVQAGWQQGPANRWQGMQNNAANAYRNTQLGYNPYTTSLGPQMQGMNYNPYHSAAVNGAQSQASNQFASAQSMLHQTGGMSAADRMRSFSDFNRQKIMGTLGANQSVDQMANQNAMDVGRYNAQRSMDVSKTNLNAQNDASRDMAMANLRRNQNLYQTAQDQKTLDRQLEASQMISNAQMNGSPNSGLLDKLLDPFIKPFTRGD